MPISGSDAALAAETLLNGLLLGALYALFGLGLSISLGVMGIINVAHGDFIVLGAYVASALMMQFGAALPVAALAFLPAMFAIGWAFQWAVLNRVAGRGPMAPLLVTFGVSIILQNLLQELFTADTRSLVFGDLAQRGFALGPVRLGLLPVASAAVSLGLYAATHLLIGRTHFGRQSRAVADDAATARLVGVDDRLFFPMVTGMVFLLIAVASVLSGLRTSFSPTAGPDRLLTSFEAVVLGGLGSLWGTFAGGLVIGVSQVLGAKVSPGLGPFFGHLAFLVVLVARPQGLLGRTGR